MPHFPTPAFDASALNINIPRGIAIPPSFAALQMQMAELQARMAGNGGNGAQAGAAGQEDILSQVKSASGRKVFDLVKDRVEQLNVETLVEALYGIAARSGFKTRQEVLGTREVTRMANRTKNALKTPSSLEPTVCAKAVYALGKLRLVGNDQALFETAAKRIDAVEEFKRLEVDTMVNAIYGLASTKTIKAQKPLATRIAREIGRRASEVSRLTADQLNELLWSVKEKALHGQKDGNGKWVTVVRREVDDDKVYNAVADRIVSMKDKMTTCQMVELLENFAAFGLARRDVFGAFGPLIFKNKGSLSNEKWKRAVVAFGRFGVPLRDERVGQAKRKAECVVREGDYYRPSDKDHMRGNKNPKRFDRKDGLNIPTHLPSMTLKK